MFGKANAAPAAPATNERRVHRADMLTRHPLDYRYVLFGMLRSQSENCQQVVSQTAFAPQTASGHQMSPPRYSTEGVRSVARKVGPSSSTLSQLFPKVKEGATASLMPILF